MLSSPQEREPSPAAFFDRRYTHSDDRAAYVPHEFDAAIMRSPKKRIHYPNHGYSLARFIAEEEHATVLPQGHNFGPNNQGGWYAEDGTLFVVDYKRLIVGDLLDPGELGVYLYQIELFEESAPRLLDRKLSSDLEYGNSSEMKITIPLFCGHNDVGQQMYALRTVAAGVLNEAKGTFSASVFGYHRIKNGKIAGSSSKAPIFKDVYLPTEIGSVQKIMQSKRYYTNATQSLLGVYIIDVPKPESSKRRGKVRRMIGELALKPNLGNI